MDLTPTPTPKAETEPPANSPADVGAQTQPAARDSLITPQVVVGDVPPRISQPRQRQPPPSTFEVSTTLRVWESAYVRALNARGTVAEPKVPPALQNDLVAAYKKLRDVVGRSMDHLLGPTDEK